MHLPAPTALAGLLGLLFLSAASATVYIPSNGLEGFVSNDDGQPIPRARIARFTDDVGWTSTSEDGHYRQYGGSGPASLLAVAPGYAPAEVWTEIPSAGFRWVNLTLARIGPTGIHGNVTSSVGTPLGAWLLPEGMGYAAWAARADSLGAYQLDLWGGTWTIHLVEKGYRTATVSLDIQNATVLERNLVMEPSTAELRLLVVDNATGKPIPKASGDMQVGRLCRVWPVPAACDYRGSWLLADDRGRAVQRLDGEWVKFWVCAPGYETQERTLEITEPTDVVVALDHQGLESCTPRGSPRPRLPPPVPLPPAPPSRVADSPARNETVSSTDAPQPLARVNSEPDAVIASSAGKPMPAVSADDVQAEAASKETPGAPLAVGLVGVATAAVVLRRRP